MTIIFAKRYFVTVSCARLYQTYFPLYVRQAFAHRLFTVEEENAQGAESKWKGGGRTFRGTVFIDKNTQFSAFIKYVIWYCGDIYLYPLILMYFLWNTKLATPVTTSRFTKSSFNVNYQSLYLPLFCVIDFVLTFHYDLCMYQILKREKPLKGVQGCGKSSYFVDVWYTDTEVIPWNHCNSVKDIRYEYLEQNNRGCKKVKKNHISRLSFL